jgi:4-hydroxy-3-methylbut-2-enyl diphosphate reductase
VTETALDLPAGLAKNSFMSIEDETGRPATTIRLCGPRGFCAGVDRAIQIVVLALKKYGAPVYVRHEIVHNRFVVEGLEARGAVFVKELDEVPATGQPVIFSAHGVPKSVPERAQSLNLLYLDATCPLVSKVHKQAQRHMRLGRHVLLVGHAGHPEVIGTMGQLPPDAATLIETEADADAFEPGGRELGYVTQTTLSVDDTAAILARLRERFPALADPAAESICYATTNRQDAVKLASRGADHFLIVGAPNSSNSRRLVEVALRAGAKRAALVRTAADIPWDELRDATVVGLSAGASAPEILVDEIISAFRQRGEARIELAETAQETELFPVMRALRDVPLQTADMAFLTGAQG